MIVCDNILYSVILWLEPIDKNYMEIKVTGHDYKLTICLALFHILMVSTWQHNTCTCLAWFWPLISFYIDLTKLFSSSFDIYSITTLVYF